MGLVTFEEKFRGYSRAAVAAQYPSSVGDTTPPVDGVAVDVRAVARVNGGRWVADCPDRDCRGAEYVSFDDPVFFCCECRNGRAGHLLIPVTVPGEKVRGQVEAYLLARPVPATRNWDQSEPVLRLRDENRERGVRLA